MNVLISSAGRRVALLKHFREALQLAGSPGRVVAIDSSDQAPAGHMADVFVVVPPCTSPEFAASVLEVCHNFDVALVVPTIDTELPIYAAIADGLAACGVSLLASSRATIEIASDKRCTHAWLTSNGYPTVPTVSRAVALNDASWPFPSIAKPACGSASKGVIRVTCRSELERLPDADLIVQPVAPGIEFTLDSFVDRSGRCRGVVPRRRLEVRNGEVSKSITTRDVDLESLGRAIVEALPGAYGPVTLQVFVDGHNYNVIEINPRFGGGYPLSWAAGARFPVLAVEEALGQTTTGQVDWEDGLTMLRYDDAVFIPMNRGVEDAR